MLDDIAQSHWVSASQESTYDLCHKKWGFEKLDRLPKPPNRYAERGLDVHKVLEKWLEKGIPVDPDTDAGKIAMPGLKFLPPPGVSLVEHNFWFESDVATYVGFWDVLVPRPRVYVGNTPIIEVYDHKTTSDLKWVKSFNELREDPQVIIYAISALFSLYERWKELCSHKPGLCLTWVYYRANPSKPGARRSQMYILPDEEKELPQLPKGIDKECFGVIRMSELEQMYQKFEDTAAELLEHHRQGHKGQDLPGNVAGCNAYGGCPYLGNPCELTTREIMRGYMAQESAADRIKARKAAAESAGDSSAEQTAAPPRQTTLSIADKIRAKTAGSEASPEAKAEAEATVRAAAEQQQPPAGRGEPAVNPPEAEQPVAQAQPEPEKAAPVQAQPSAPAQPSTEGRESFTVTALGLAERVHYASIITAGLVSGAPSLDSIGEEAVAKKALDIVDAITLKAVR